MDETYKTVNTSGGRESSFNALYTYAERSHEIFKLVIKIGLIAFFAVPIVLLIMNKITDGDKVISLLIWIVCMFVLALVLILVGYFDKRLQHAIEGVKGETYSLGKLKIVNSEQIDKMVLQSDEKLENIDEKLENIDEKIEDIEEKLKEKIQIHISHETKPSQNEDEFDIDKIIEEVKASDDDEN